MKMANWFDVIRTYSSMANCISDIELTQKKEIRVNYD